MTDLLKLKKKHDEWRIFSDLDVKQNHNLIKWSHGWPIPGKYDN